MTANWSQMLPSPWELGRAGFIHEPRQQNGDELDPLGRAWLPRESDGSADIQRLIARQHPIRMNGAQTRVRDPSGETVPSSMSSPASTNSGSSGM
jgi:hypothetical protein